MVFLGFDDTDSRQGGCTTYLATEFLREFEDVDLIGLPRLVRLNPNIPWKTRGNGALCLRFGRGRGIPKVVGRIGAREILAYPRGDRASAGGAFEARVRAVFEHGCAFDDPGTEPGFALLNRRPAASLYWQVVRRVVEVDEALAAGKGCGRVIGYKGGRGRIGALAAVSWRPRRRTFEVIAYREPSRWGTPRGINAASVVEMDRAFPSTFHNYDYANGRVVLAPHSPCPILCGVRGTVPEELPRALEALQTEPKDRWLLFETNQGTDDHLIPASNAPLLAGTSVWAEGEVAAAPRTLPGGHVVFSLARGSSVEDCTAYESSKQFRRVARSLRVGDRVRVAGAVRDRPRTINLEKLEVLSLASKVRRTLAVGMYAPAVSARRHLARPVSR